MQKVGQSLSNLDPYLRLTVVNFSRTSDNIRALLDSIQLTVDFTYREEIELNNSETSVTVRSVKVDS